MTLKREDLVSTALWLDDVEDPKCYFCGELPPDGCHHPVVLIVPEKGILGNYCGKCKEET